MISLVLIFIKYILKKKSGIIAINFQSRPNFETIALISKSSLLFKPDGVYTKFIYSHFHKIAGKLYLGFVNKTQ